MGAEDTLMSKNIRAHFDGKVIVPDEPIELPVDQPLEVQLLTTSRAMPESKERHQALERLKARAIHGLRISPEDV